MPRGKYVNHKGRNRQFTSREEMDEAMKKERLAKTGSGKDNVESNSDYSEEDSDVDHKAKGIETLIEIENPNRGSSKNPNALNINVGGKPELSRRQREQLERQRTAANYQKLHAEGKTEQARADLARLAIIKQQRAEAAEKRAAEKKAKEEKKKSSNLK